MTNPETLNEPRKSAGRGKSLLLALIALLLFSSARLTAENPKHEMRGAWIATVYGIDWPTKTGTTRAVADAQRKELTDILDLLKEAGLNSVVFQVRSMSDAMYRSSLEPWSAYLTGTRGEAPADGWDPLEFAVEEAHKRGLELHAWVNPFRLSTSKTPAPVRSATGENRFDPVGKGWTLNYSKAAPAKKTKSKKKSKKSASPQPSVSMILDPSNSDARRHIVDVCREIISNYDVDGLIFDDYFYPDGIPTGSGPDFKTYKASGSKLTHAAWRRENVNRAIREVYTMVQETKPWVRFGVSPAGVAGGNGAAVQPYGLPTPPVGKDWMYDRIFCDPVAWLAEGTVDYVSPQLYWATDHSTNPYAPLSHWWSDIAHHFGRHFFSSQKVVAAGTGPAAWKEQGEEVRINREAEDYRSPGTIFYSTAHLTGKKAAGLADYMKENEFSLPALLPAMTWKTAKDPGTVKRLKIQGSTLSWHAQPGMRYVVYAIPMDISPVDALSSTGSNFTADHIIAVTYSNSVELPAAKRKGHWYAVAPYDRYGNEWAATTLNAPKF